VSAASPSPSPTSSTRPTAATTRTSTARARRLHQEHDHRCRADGRRDPGRVAADGPMPQTREHILLARQVEGALHRGVPQQGRHGRRPGAAELVELEVAELLSKYTSRVTTSRSSGVRPEGARGTRQPGRSRVRAHPGADGRGRLLHPHPERAVDRPFLMPSRTCSASRAAARCHRAHRAGHREGRRFERDAWASRRPARWS
jgi:hypothetical protein